MDTQSTPSTTPWTSRSAPRATTIVSDANYRAKGRNTPRTLIVVGGGEEKGGGIPVSCVLGEGGDRMEDRETRREREERRRDQTRTRERNRKMVGRGSSSKTWGGLVLGGEVDVGCVYKALK